MDEIELRPGDAVRVAVGPYRGKKGTVKRVMRMPREKASAAMVFVEFADGSEGYQVGANLEKLEGAKKGG